MPYTTVSNADLFVHPGRDPSADLDLHTENTLSDTHGQLFTILHFLVNRGVMDITPEDYQTLAEIYNRHATLLDKLEIANTSKGGTLHRITTLKQQILKDFEQFESILSKSTFNTEVLTRFMGDGLSSEVGNDWFTLLLFKILHEKKAKYEILESDNSHDFKQAFVEARTTNNSKKCAAHYRNNSRFITDDSHRESSLNMARLIELGVLKQTEITEVVRSAYLPYSKLVSYSVVGDKVYLYLHAPSALETIRSLANTFRVTYAGTTIKEFIQTIDAINQKYQFLMKNNPRAFLEGWWKQYQNALEQEPFKSNQQFVLPRHPLVRILCNHEHRDGYTPEMDLGINNNIDFELHVVHDNTGATPFPGFKPEWEGLFHPMRSDLDNYSIFMTKPQPAKENTVRNTVKTNNNSTTKIMQTLVENNRSVSIPKQQQSEHDLDAKQSVFNAAHQAMLIVLQEWRNTSQPNTSDPELTQWIQLSHTVNDFKQNPKNQQKFIAMVQALLSTDENNLPIDNQKTFCDLRDVVFNAAAKEYDLMLTRAQIAPTKQTSSIKTLTSKPPISFAHFFQAKPQSCAGEIRNKDENLPGDGTEVRVR